MFGSISKHLITYPVDLVENSVLMGTNSGMFAILLRRNVEKLELSFAACGSAWGPCTCYKVHLSWKGML